MRHSGQVRGEIEELQGKLRTLDETIDRKRSERSALLLSHVALGELCIGKERLPKSYERQRELLLTLDLEIENLDRVKANLESKLTQLQSELTRAVLYEEKVAGYRSAEQEFFELTESVCKEIELVNQAIDAFGAHVEEYLKGSGNPLAVLKSLLDEPALQGLSLESFFAGETRHARPGENAVFIRNLMQSYRDLPKKLPLPSSFDKDWRVFSDRLDFIVSAAGGLVPREARYVVSEEPMSN